MDNFMEQPTYKMNRGAILAQGLRSLARTAGQMWKGACPRWRCISLHKCRLIQRYRRQAPYISSVSLLDQVMSAATGASSPMACRRA
ncbi:hypothetical protein E4O97_20295 [Pseudomonas sp. W15Feb34]|nr:hypothetical protein [Pseudomonas sp. W15Feb34]